MPEFRRNKMGGPLTNHEKSREFYRFAYACEEQSKRCDHQCAVCSLNVHLYCDDPREATLIKTSARLDYSRRGLSDFSQWLLSAFMYIVIIGGLIFGVWSCVSCSSAPKQSTVNIAQQTYDTAVYVKSHIYDVDRDGLIDCVDYATLYFDKYPDKSNLRLMWVYRADIDETHLYVRVNGTDIEPQSINPDFSKRTLRYHWGNKMNYRKIKDVTAYAGQIRNNTFHWIWER
jgi:hypothetical protein